MATSSAVASRRRRGGAARLVGAALVLALAAACELAAPADDRAVLPAQGAGGPTASAPTPDGSPSPAAGSPAARLLQQASGGDGDSWRDASGTEYRLGLVNAPEVDDCFGSEATERRRTLLAAGFVAHVYTRDRYGRSVAQVTTADGRDLAVVLAREGFVDDRYLEQFAAENPELAARLRPAFAAAQRDGAGLWSACRGDTRGAPAPAASPEPLAVAPAAAPAAGCHPAYTPCVPVAGDGSGTGAANDLDCGSVGGRVEVRRPGVDPYRLDGDGDGAGCESRG